jgi:hypothetical protein
MFSVTDLNFWEHERANFPLAGSDTTTDRRLITALTEIYRSIKFRELRRIFWLKRDEIFGLIKRGKANPSGSAV